MIKPDPPALLSDTREAIERLDARGNVVTPVDREQVKGIVRDLVDSGVESLTIGLINSYVNSAHEEEIGAIVEELYPGFPVTLSSHVLPEFREYERTLTACMNSYVRPTVATYVKGLQSSLKDLGTTCDVNILRSDAGLMTTTEAQRNPIYGVLSGPVRRRRRGAARRHQGGLSEHPHVRHGRDVHRRRAVPERRADDRPRDVDQPLPHQDPERQRAHGRRRRRLDRPRAAAHRRASRRAAVGRRRAGPGGLRQGRRGADRDRRERRRRPPAAAPARRRDGRSTSTAARAAVQKIADAMSLSLEQAADGILSIVNENMAGALRLVSVQRGHDPRDFALVAFGGAGPLHANAVAKLMGSYPVIVPPSPGLLCAIGDLVADFRNEFARTLIRLVREAPADEVAGILEELGGRAREWMDSEGIAASDQRLSYVADMRYHGQGYEIPVALDAAAVRAQGLGDLEERFNALHEQLYGFRMHATASEIVNLRAIGNGSVQKPELPTGTAGGADPSGAVVEEHAILFEGENVPTRIYDRSKLSPGARIPGPAVVTEFDSTTVVLPGFTAEVDIHFNLLINPEA